MEHDLRHVVRTVRGLDFVDMMSTIIVTQVNSIKMQSNFCNSNPYLPWKKFELCRVQLIKWSRNYLDINNSIANAENNVFIEMLNVHISFNIHMYYLYNI